MEVINMTKSSSCPEGASSLNLEMEKISMPPLLLHYLSSLASLGIPYEQWTEEDRSWDWFADISVWYKSTYWKWTAEALQFLYGTSLKSTAGRKPPVWRHHTMWLWGNPWHRLIRVSSSVKCIKIIPTAWFFLEIIWDDTYGPWGHVLHCKHVMFAFIIS